jgi:nitrogen fixation/metabolism regulation signal transduction histidine kinase
VKILANPIILRAAVVLFCSTFAFVFALIMMRLLRKSITEEAEISSEGTPTFETLPLHVYNTVIQQLKQQQQSDKAQAQAEQTRARHNEALSQAVISNLSCGVVIFGTNGLVKTSNPAAKTILGFVSPTGMSAEDIFRGAVISRPLADEANTLETAGHNADELANETVCVADEISAALRPGSRTRKVEAEYETPADEKRFLAVTVAPASAEDGSLLGVACVIDDRTELEIIRSGHELRRDSAAAGVGATVS